MKTFKTIIISLVVIILVLLIVQNLEILSKTEVYELNLLVFDIQSPPIQTIVLLLFIFVTGFILAYIFGLIKQRRLKKTIKNLNRIKAQTDEELKRLAKPAHYRTRYWHVWQGFRAGGRPGLRLEPLQSRLWI